METSSTQPVGLKWYWPTCLPRPRLGPGPAGRGEGSKKNPQPSPERLGILPASTLHSLSLEDLLVKSIQTRFSDSPDLNSPSHRLTLRQAQGSGLRAVAFTLRHLFRSHGIGITAAGPSPTFSVERRSRGSLRPDTTQQNYLLFKRFEEICQEIRDDLRNF